MSLGRDTTCAPGGAAPAVDNPKVTPALKKVALAIAAADKKLRADGYQTYFKADLARELHDDPDNFRKLVSRHPQLIAGLPIRDPGGRGRVPKRVSNDVAKPVPNVPNVSANG